MTAFDDPVARTTARMKAWLQESGPIYRDTEVVVDGEPWSTARDRQSDQFKRFTDDFSLSLLSYASEAMFFDAPEGSTVTLKVRVK